MPDNYENNGNLAAAIAGIALATEVNDSFNDNSDNSTNVDVGVEDSFNDNSDNSTDLDVEIKDSLNDSSDNSTNVGLNDVLNDKSDNSIDVAIEDSLNDNSDNSTNVDVALSDSFNDSSTDDDINNSFNDASTNVDIEVTDSFKTDDSVNDSFNTDFSLDVAVSDSFNTSDSDWLDLDNVSFDAMTIISDALNGAGNDAAFSAHQINEMSDNDFLMKPQVVNNGHWGQSADAGGGEAYGIKTHDDVGNGSGDHQSLSAAANASATSGNEAFTQNIVMGANIQYNSVNSTIVGGDSDISSADSFA